MTNESMNSLPLQALQKIDGEQRRLAATRLWNAWRHEKQSAAIITGFSGLGKTRCVVNPLIRQALSEGVIALSVEVPLVSISTDYDLVAPTLEALHDNGYEEIAAKLSETNPNSFRQLIKELLKRGALVVIDEFQRLLDLNTRLPVGNWANGLAKLAQRPGDDGCLWLISNRTIDEGWSEPFQLVPIRPPEANEEAIAIVLKAADTYADKFDVERQEEVVRRLGANPRALALLGKLLHSHSLEELVGKDAPLPEAPHHRGLINAMEVHLLQRAAQDIPPAATSLLQALSAVTEKIPRELAEHLAKNFTHSSAELLEELRKRFILEQEDEGRIRLHPAMREVALVGLRDNLQEWHTANLKIAHWYADCLAQGARKHLSGVALGRFISLSRFHYDQAGSSAQIVESALHLREYIEQRFGWNTRRPDSDMELNDSISLLEIFLSKPGDASMEYAIAKLLSDRGLPGDNNKALTHAKLAVLDQDREAPWLLLMKLVGEIEDEHCLVSVARNALFTLSAERNLNCARLLARLLTSAQPPENVFDLLLQTAIKIPKDGDRIIDDVLTLAAAKSPSYLKTIQEFLADRDGFGPQQMLAKVMIFEAKGGWSEAGHAARRARADSLCARYLHLCAHESIAWLGANRPVEAQKALDSFGRIEYGPNIAITWLAALVAIENENFVAAENFLSIYLGRPAPMDAASIYAVLNHEYAIDTTNKDAPSLCRMLPIIPARLKQPGLLDALLFGSATTTVSVVPIVTNTAEMAKAVSVVLPSINILAIGTEWGSSKGGLSTFNRNLCVALAANGAHVVCLVESDEKLTGLIDGVTVIAARHVSNLDPHAALTRRPTLPEGFVPDFLIGHGRITGTAAKALQEDFFSNAKRLHFVHMAPDEIEWLKDGRRTDSGTIAENRRNIETELADGASHVVAVGPRLYDRYVRDLNAMGYSSVLRFDPGFDFIEDMDHAPPRGELWAMLTLGRLEDATLKGLDIAAMAAGVVKRRQRVVGKLELIARGAPPNESDDTYRKISAWCGKAPHPNIVVRPFTSDSGAVTSDIRAASLMLMPSRREGFGLVGLETIAAGVPTLVSSESGLAELLREALTPEIAARIIVPVTNDVETDTENWASAIEMVLKDRTSAFQQANATRKILANKYSWKSSIQKLLTQVTHT